MSKAEVLDIRVATGDLWDDIAKENFMQFAEFRELALAVHGHAMELTETWQAM